MRCTSMSLACLFVMLFIAVAATAQMPMPKPAPELSKLDYLAGTWIGDGDLKPGPMGPGGKISSTDELRWMEGKFFLVMRSKYTGAMGDGTGLAIFGYDPEKKAYTYNAYNSWGEVGRSTGTVDGDTWTWTSVSDQPFKGRYTMKILSPTSYTFGYETSKNGKEWTTVMEGKATKTK